jgi:hypothetical protein
MNEGRDVLVGMKNKRIYLNYGSDTEIYRKN